MVKQVKTIGEAVKIIAFKVSEFKTSGKSVQSHGESRDIIITLFIPSRLTKLIQRGFYDFMAAKTVADFLTDVDRA